MADEVTPGQPPVWPAAPGAWPPAQGDWRPDQQPPYQQPPYQQSPPGAWQPPAGWPPPYQPPPYQPPGYPPQPYGPGYGFPTTPRTEPLSIWSLILGGVSFVLPVIAATAAIVTGSRAKKAIKNSAGTKTGSGMATAGQVLGWANIFVSVVAGILIAVLVSFFAHHKNYTSLNPGDCFDRRRGTNFLATFVTTVSCTKPHQQETVGVFDYPGTGSQGWPGRAGIEVVAGPRCLSLTNQYVAQPRPSGLLPVFWYPNQQQWDNGTRRIVCAVRNADGTTRTGSVHFSLGPSTNG